MILALKGTVRSADGAVRLIEVRLSESDVDRHQREMNAGQGRPCGGVDGDAFNAGGLNGWGCVPDA
jgi:hypothetical protein